jgi:hypothetical protein
MFIILLIEGYETPTNLIHVRGLRRLPVDLRA